MSVEIQTYSGYCPWCKKVTTIRKEISTSVDKKPYTTRCEECHTYCGGGYEEFNRSSPQN